MANPNPPKEHLRPIPWKPGQPGNPSGYSRGRRLSDALKRFIDENGMDEKVITALVGAAIGDKKLLKGRTPSAAFMAMLLDRVEGKVAQTVINQEAPKEPPDGSGNEPDRDPLDDDAPPGPAEGTP